MKIPWPRNSPNVPPIPYMVSACKRLECTCDGRAAKRLPLTAIPFWGIGVHFCTLELAFVKASCVVAAAFT